jgi:hypothetical protein
LTYSRELLEEIESLITAVYRDRTTDPWSCSVERSESFERLFRQRIPKWPLRNQTDIEFGGATAIAFLLHPGHYIGVPTRDGLETRISRLGGQCFMALVEISHLGPFARIRFTRETFNRHTGVLGYDEQEYPFRDEDQSFLELIHGLLKELDIIILPREILDQRVPDIELDVTNPGCATVYHCLFDEE